MEQNFDLYKTTEFSEWAFKEGLSPAEDFILRSLNPVKSVLEAGTGGGRLLHALALKGFRSLAGFDSLADFINVAKSRDSVGTIQFDIADARKLLYSDEQFDQCLYLQQLLCFIEDKSDRCGSLRELRRVLKIGGVAYLSFLFRETREQTVVGIISKWYLKFLRKFVHQDLPFSLQPWLKRGRYFNLSCLWDAPPYVCWYSLHEALEDVRNAGLVVQGVATDHQLAEGRWVAPDALRKETMKGFLYLKCSKE